MKKEKTMKERRGFLKSALAFGAGIGLLGMFGKKAKAESGEKIKLLTPDGKLVEIDKTHIEKESNERASNTEVREWMNRK